jgi:hypothetical protein
MKEFIDKLIERLEEERKKVNRDNKNKFCPTTDLICKESAFIQAISIVNKLAEEYNMSEMPTSWVIDGKGIHKQTNADRIRSMTDEELAEYISELIRNSHEYMTGEGDWLIWLQSEAE